jgi:hypothetical protein
MQQWPHDTNGFVVGITEPELILIGKTLPMLVCPQPV